MMGANEIIYAKNFPFPWEKNPRTLIFNLQPLSWELPKIIKV